MIGDNTHGALIAWPDGSTAWLDGIPDTCPHTRSDAVYISASGKTIHWYTYRQWASLCEDARGRLIQEYHQQIEDPIVCFTTECRECKRIYHPPMF